MAKVSKEQIIDTALTLFSVRGYEATSMNDIAEVLGIKAPSLYYHFKSKQDLFDHMVEAMRSYFWKSYPSLHAPYPNENDEARSLATDIELTKQVAKKTFLFYFRDKYAGTFRKLLTIERYNNPQMDAVFRELYFDAPINNQTDIFNGMIRQGLIPSEINPYMAAIETFAPFLLLMNKYDMSADKETIALSELEEHIEQIMGLLIGSRAYT